MKGLRNLSFRSVKRPKRGNRCVLQLSKSQENALVLWFIHKVFLRHCIYSNGWKFLSWVCERGTIGQDELYGALPPRIKLYWVATPGVYRNPPSILSFTLNTCQEQPNVHQQEKSTAQPTNIEDHFKQIKHKSLRISLIIAQCSWERTPERYSHVRYH